MNPTTQKTRGGMVKRIPAAGIAVAVGLWAALVSFASAGTVQAASDQKPNIVILLADDLGFADLGCNGATKIKTPNLDRLARAGMNFRNAHSPASVCTPSRYNLLTGRYAWRLDTPEHRRAQTDQWKGDRLMPKDGRYVGHVAIESNEPLMIEDGRMTIASMLKSAGYATACVGKWHLGFGRVDMPGWDETRGPDWNGMVKPGPLEVGFDYYFGLPIVNGSQPKVFLENHRVIGLDPTDPIKLVPAYSTMGRLQYAVTGGKAAMFDPSEIDGRNVEKAVAWLEKVAPEKKPFSLYVAFTNPHGPFAPGPQFKGSTEIGPYGDAVQELDWRVGEILAALDRLGVAGNTLVIFASDNGSGMGAYRSGVDHAPNLKGHIPNGPFRGEKTEAYEGGTRVPFIVRWPGQVKPGSTSTQLVALTDAMATFAAIVGKPMPANAGEDSFNFLPALGGGKSERQSLVTDSMLGQFAYREGDWKLIAGTGGAGYYPNYEAAYVAQPGELPGQLFNLAEDPGERRNLYAEHPEIVARLQAALEKTKRDGRSRR